MPEEKKSRLWLWILVGATAFFVLLLAVFALVGLAMRGSHGGEFAGFGDKIGVIDVEGVILDPRTVVKQLREFRRDDSIRAIILHVNTPGGGAAASQEIYSEVRRIRDEKKKKIVASIETLGASGGYYISAATEKIYADPASIVGSIGVISQWVNYEDLLKWAKLKDVTFKAGALKDTGNPARPMTPEEKAYFQSLINDMHGQFISAVAAGPKLKRLDYKAMTKADLIEQVAQVVELTRRDSEVVVETIFESIVRSLRTGDKIEIRGFGSFRTRQRKPRVGRNPKTGARVDVPAKKIPFFKPSKELKDVVNHASTPA